MAWAAKAKGRRRSEDDKGNPDRADEEIDKRKRGSELEKREGEEKAG